MGNKLETNNAWRPGWMEVYTPRAGKKGKKCNMESEFDTDLGICCRSIRLPGPGHQSGSEGGRAIIYS